MIMPFKMEFCLYLLRKLKPGGVPGNLTNQSKKAFNIPRLSAHLMVGTIRRFFFQKFV